MIHVAVMQRRLRELINFSVVAIFLVVQTGKSERRRSSSRHLQMHMSRVVSALSKGLIGWTRQQSSLLVIGLVHVVHAGSPQCRRFLAVESAS